MSAEGYVPAAGRESLTGLYDFAMAVTMRERRWRPLLVDRIQRGISPGATVVDVGAGTATLALMLAKALPSVEVIAIDGDPEVLEIARRKPGAEKVEFRRGLATGLEVPDASADAVVLCLLLHHLGADDKLRALAEARRVVRADGRLLVADWGRPSVSTTPGFWALRALDGFANTKAHADGRIPDLVEGGGFGTVETFGRLSTVWGSLELIEARP